MRPANRERPAGTAGDRLPFFVSIHEAGHATGCWATGTDFDEVIVRTWTTLAEPFVDRRGRNLGPLAGIVVGSPHHHSGFPWPKDMNASVRASILIDAAILAGGPLAEARYRKVHGGCALVDSGSDMDAIQRLTADYAATFDPPDVSTSLFTDVMAVHRRLTRGLWPATLAVAEALHARGRLSHRDVLRIIESVTGAGQRPYSFLLARLGPAKRSSPRRAEAAHVPQTFDDGRQDEGRTA